MKIGCNFSKRYFGVIQIDNKQYNLYNLIKQSSTEWMLKYSEIYDGLAKHLYIDDVNYAYLLNYFLKYSSNYFSVAGLDIILPYIIILDNFVTENVELTVVDALPNVFKQCASMVCKTKGVRLRVIKEHYIKRGFNFLYNNHWIIRKELFVRLCLRYLIGLLRKLTRKQNRAIADVLILSNIRFSTHNEENNLIFGPVIDELKKRGRSWKLLRYEKLTQTTNLKRYVKEFMLEPVAYIGDYYTMKHFIECHKVFKQLRERWNEIKQSKEVKSLFVFRGYDFYNIILPRLELMFNALSYIAVDAAKITRRIAERERYKVLVLDHEENMYGKGFMLNTRGNSSCKTLALSHEIIAPGCIHTHVKNPVVLSKSSKLWRPLPDIKCVWGEYAKEILINHCNYPASIIHITGNPKFDFISNTRFDKHSIIRKYKLSDKPKLLFASSRIPSVLLIVRDIIESIKGYQVIVKPHPNEDMGTLLQAFEGLRGGFKIVPKYADIYELISVSDYVMTVVSTVGFEAMLMNKLVLILNPEKSYLGGLPFVESGSAIEIQNSTELIKALENLSRPDFRKRIESKRDGFVKFIHSKNDGKARARVADLLEKLLDGSF